ncbi:hypothetical protein [Streptosporangium sp. NPDC051022]|uniref:hypothetical protein n=1 Tax=Streptosporangium sp. NPDC051022 TaxID=3155752 RepID=UPI0034445629
MSLPTFEEMRRNAYRLLGDAEDELRSDWAPGSEPTHAQALARREAMRLIARAKVALNRAAQ